MKSSNLNRLLIIITVTVISFAVLSSIQAQSFDFSKIYPKVSTYTVTIEMQIEVSFGINSSDQEERYLGTIVTKEGMVIFDGTDLASDNLFSSFSGFTVKTTPKKITVTTLDGLQFDAEYLGYDRYTKIGFIQIKSEGQNFTPITFNKHHQFKVGEWLSLYMLLPDFISPPLAADIGMVSNLVESPEPFPLTVGFNGMQLTSVLYNSAYEPVGILGNLMDPSSAGGDFGGSESFGNVGLPLLGVITAERLESLISSPPTTKGEIERGWLGISLQALTKDIAEFWSLPLSGGIIVNEIIKNSPADKGGVKVGDIIYEVNGQTVEVDREEKVAVFQRMISSMGPGAEVELAVMRNSDANQDSAKLIVTLQKAPISPSDAPDYEDESLELTVRDLVFADYMINNLDSEDFKGVVVSELVQGGPASIGGLSIGDIVQRIGSTEIESVGDAENALKKINKEKPREVIFFIWRRNQTMFVNVKPSWN